MQTTAVEAKGSAPGATAQRVGEIELLFIGLLGNFESLKNQHAEVCRGWRPWSLSVLLRR